MRGRALAIGAVFEAAAVVFFVVVEIFIIANFVVGRCPLTISLPDNTCLIGIVFAIPLNLHDFCGKWIATPLKLQDHRCGFRFIVRQNTPGDVVTLPTFVSSQPARE